MTSVPFYIPYHPDEVNQLLKAALMQDIQCGGGFFSKEVTRAIALKYECEGVLITPSCTSAIELSLMCLDLKQGDEVILPSYNFTSAATAVTKFWGTPVFCDIDVDTGLLNIEMVESLLTHRTKAIIWVDYGGLLPDKQELKRIAKSKGIILIEDAAHNFGIKDESRQEVFGDFVTFSFHATKNIQCGEGGALIINNPEYRDRALIIQEKGTNRRLMLEGRIDKYSWIDRGGSFLVSEITSAILKAQLDQFEYIQQKRVGYVNRYYEAFGDVDGLGWKLSPGLQNSAHMFFLIAPSRNIRNQVANLLKIAGISAFSHYEDLSSSVAGMKYGRTKYACDKSKEFSSKILRLPLYVSLEDKQEFVVEECINAIKQIGNAD